MTYEPPRGLKANLQSTWRAIDEASFERCPQCTPTYRKLLFGLTALHALLQERRKFGPLGFNIGARLHPHPPPRPSSALPFSHGHSPPSHATCPRHPARRRPLRRVPYDFNETDREISIETLAMLLSSSPSPATCRGTRCAT